MNGNALRLVCVVGSVALAVLGGCTSVGSGPVVEEHDRALGEADLSRVAVVPFAAALRAGGEGSAGEATRIAVALADALAGAGLDVVGPREVLTAVAARGEPVPNADPADAVRMARELGATAVVIGRLTRFRDRVGTAAGVTVSASVAFEVLVHDVASGRWLWTGRFDETQASLSADVLRARRLPGGGTRWLTGRELAAWGAAEAARSIASRR